MLRDHEQVHEGCSGALLARESLEQIRERLIASGPSSAAADYEMRRAESSDFHLGYPEDTRFRGEQLRVQSRWT
jgi:hypothetical protein